MDEIGAAVIAEDWERSAAIPSEASLFGGVVFKQNGSEHSEEYAAEQIYNERL